jgi:hypothetical protein
VNPLVGRKLSGKKLLHWLPPLPLQEFKNVRKSLGGITVNDVTSTAAARAVWRYMEECVARHSDSCHVDKPWVTSEEFAVANWLKYPKKLKNKFGLCRLVGRPATHLPPPLDDLLARRAEINFQVTDTVNSFIM